MKWTVCVVFGITAADDTHDFTSDAATVTGLGGGPVSPHEPQDPLALLHDPDLLIATAAKEKAVNNRVLADAEKQFAMLALSKRLESMKATADGTAADATPKKHRRDSSEDSALTVPILAPKQDRPLFIERFYVPHKRRMGRRRRQQQTSCASATDIPSNHVDTVGDAVHSSSAPASPQSSTIVAHSESFTGKLLSTFRSLFIGKAPDTPAGTLPLTTGNTDALTTAAPAPGAQCSASNGALLGKSTLQQQMLTMKPSRRRLSLIHHNSKLSMQQASSSSSPRALSVGPDKFASQTVDDDLAASSAHGVASVGSVVSVVSHSSNDDSNSLDSPHGGDSDRITSYQYSTASAVPTSENGLCESIGMDDSYESPTTLSRTQSFRNATVTSSLVGRTLPAVPIQRLKDSAADVTQSMSPVTSRIAALKASLESVTAPARQDFAVLSSKIDDISRQLPKLRHRVHESQAELDAAELVMNRVLHLKRKLLDAHHALVKSNPVVTATVHTGTPVLSRRRRTSSISTTATGGSLLDGLAQLEPPPAEHGDVATTSPSVKSVTSLASLDLGHDDEHLLHFGEDSDVVEIQRAQRSRETVDKLQDLARQLKTSETRVHAATTDWRK